MQIHEPGNHTPKHFLTLALIFSSSFGLSPFKALGTSGSAIFGASEPAATFFCLCASACTGFHVVNHNMALRKIRCIYINSFRLQTYKVYTLILFRSTIHSKPPSFPPLSKYINNSEKVFFELKVI